MASSSRLDRVRSANGDRRPLIGITADVAQDKLSIRRSYAAMVSEAGGLPVILPCLVDCASEYVQRCDGIILTGGDDPIMTHWGVSMHPKATPVHPDRQDFELAILDMLDDKAGLPVLGICLGMQLMGLHAGGKLNQFLPDTLATAALHWDEGVHEISGEIGAGLVKSHHRQALTDAGRLQVIAHASDGVIEAVQARDRPLYLGVQWHPEQTADPNLGIELIRRVVDVARMQMVVAI